MPIPERAQFKWSRLLNFALVGVVIGFLVMSFLDNKVLYDMGEFFTKEELFTLYFWRSYAIYQGVKVWLISTHWLPLR